MRAVVIGALACAACTHDSLPAVPMDAPLAIDAPAHDGPGPGGGLLDDLRFAIVGDTRPVNIDDTAHYPTDIITQIWTDVAAEQPAIPFAISTGDYMYAATNFAEQAPQLDIYLQARTAYPGVVYPAMGNHECTGYTDSNCGAQASDGEPANYTQFMTRMIAPIGETTPYYIERFAARDGSWSAKLVFVAGNAWDDTQQVWLQNVLSEPTTYTFVIRHEGIMANTAPGVTPSQGLVNIHPLTQLIVGHTHTYRHDLADRQLVVGNGGAPLSGGADYGYVVIARNADGTLTATSYDYLTHATVDQFTIDQNGENITP
jgi:hypothetical protein